MATTSKVLARTAAATTSATLYTQPNTSTITVVTNVLVTNTTTTSASSVSVGAYDTTVIDLKQVIPASNPAATITGSASTTGVNFHISGVEIA